MKKSINDLTKQLHKCAQMNRNNKINRFNRIYFGFERDFEKRFGVCIHTKQCKEFIEKYGQDTKF